MKRAFTIIELMVVILVVMILAGITVVTMRSARVLFTGVTAKNELSILDAALEQYKSKYGEYPPDNLDPAAVKRHILKRWPEVLKNIAVIPPMGAMGIPTDPEQALLFWLCGPPVATGDPDIPFMPRPFSLDKKDPFRYDFTANVFLSLTDGDNGETPFIDPSYTSAKNGGKTGNCDGNSFVFRGAPIVYFRAEKNGYIYPDPAGIVPLLIKDREFPAELPFEENCATPYMQNGKWINPDSYQLIMAGPDGNFGASYGKIDPDTGEPKITCVNDFDWDGAKGDLCPEPDIAVPSTLTRQAYDNITNFTSGAFLDSIISGN